MAMFPPEEVNPFRAPIGTIGGPGRTAIGSDAELIRRTYLSRESSIRSLGTLNYLAAFFCVLAVGFCGLAAVGAINTNQGNNPAATPRLLMASLAGLGAVGLLIYGGIGYGLRNLQPWARWVTIAMMGLSVLSNLIQLVLVAIRAPALMGSIGGRSVAGSIIPGLILYVMASSKSNMVFSREYREVVRQTPHIKQKTSIIVKIFLGLLIFVLLVAILAGVASRFAAR